VVITNAQGDKRRETCRDLPIQLCQHLIGRLDPANRREEQETQEHGVVDSAGLLEMPRLETLEELNVDRTTAVLVAEPRVAVSDSSAHVANDHSEGYSCLIDSLRRFDLHLWLNM